MFRNMGCFWDIKWSSIGLRGL